MMLLKNQISHAQEKRDPGMMSSFLWSSGFWTIPFNEH